MEFKKYRRTQIAEMRPVLEKDLLDFIMNRKISVLVNKENPINVSISDVDLQNGSPKIGDMIARNPENHLDQWLVAEDYFKSNFEDYTLSGAKPND